MTTMSRLARTPELHRLLDSVAEGHVVHHSGCTPWPFGWSWVDGAHMDNQTNDIVDTLWHAGLVTFPTPPKSSGNTAVLTFEGSRRLAEWNVRYPKGGVA